MCTRIFICYQSSSILAIVTKKITSHHPQEAGRSKTKFIRNSCPCTSCPKKGDNQLEHCYSERKLLVIIVNIDLRIKKIMMSMLTRIKIDVVYREGNVAVAGGARAHHRISFSHIRGVSLRVMMAEQVHPRRHLAMNF